MVEAENKGMDYSSPGFILLVIVAAVIVALGGTFLFGELQKWWYARIRQKAIEAGQLNEPQPKV